jgi:hypothetical protein
MPYSDPLTFSTRFVDVQDHVGPADGLPDGDLTTVTLSLTIARNIMETYCGAPFEATPFTEILDDRAPYGDYRDRDDWWPTRPRPARFHTLCVQTVTSVVPVIQTPPLPTAVLPPDFTWTFTPRSNTIRFTAYAVGPLAVSGTYGITPDVPPEIVWCQETMARAWLGDLNTLTPSRALTGQTADGLITYGQPGKVGWPTGIPDVNAILNRFRRNIVAY